MGKVSSTATTIMPRLPQELIDVIIDYHEYDRRTLKACSLVSSKWSARSRKHLFREVELGSKAELASWCTLIHPGPSGPSSFVETLSLYDLGFSTAAPQYSRAQFLQQSTLSDATPHFRSFSGLRSLEVRGWNTGDLRVSLMLNCISASLESVTHLTLECMLVHPLTFATFISHFPHLDYLSIDGLWRPQGVHGLRDIYDDSPASVVPTHPHGEIVVLDAMRIEERKEVFNSIVLLEPRFHRVLFQDVRCDAWRDFWPLVEACSGSLEELEIRITPEFGRVNYDGLSLACCPNLRRIRLLSGASYRPPGASEFIDRCLSTITSTQLSEVSVVLLWWDDSHRAPDSNASEWNSLDIILDNLAGKYRPRREGDQMLVKYHNTNICDSWDLLWRCKRRGIVRMNTWIDVESSEDEE